MKSVEKVAPRRWSEAVERMEKYLGTSKQVLTPARSISRDNQGRKKEEGNKAGGNDRRNKTKRKGRKGSNRLRLGTQL